MTFCDALKSSRPGRSEADPLWIVDSLSDFYQQSFLVSSQRPLQNEPI